MKIQSSSVVKNQKLSSDMYELVFDKGSCSGFLPGQFLQVHLNNCQSMLLPKPFSIFQETSTTYSILYKIYGEGTRAMSLLKNGDVFEFWGPLGNAFNVFDHEKRALVAGGVGIPPIVALVEKFNHLEGSWDVYLGGRTQHDILCIDILKSLGANLYISTDDGTLGHRGVITELFQKQASDYDQVYTCGPIMMEKIVSQICLEKNINCQVSMEEYMACGLGICVGCVVPIKDNSDIIYKRLCVEGPVIDANQIAWEVIT